MKEQKDTSQEDSDKQKKIKGSENRQNASI